MPRKSTESPATGSLVLAGDRPAGQVGFETEMVQFFVDAAELMGVPESVAAIYGIVFASPEPLSFSEISARLDFSNGSVSQGLKILKEIGAVRVAEGRSSAGRPRFEPDTEMRRLIQRFIEQRVETQLRQGKARLTTLATAAEAYGEAERKILDQRLNKLRRWHDRTRAMMPVIRTFLKLAKS